jgi:hypothetical protein
MPDTIASRQVSVVWADRDIPNKRQELLVHPGNAAGHPQWTHPHPQFSPDGQMVLYNSDVTGICQIDLAHMPDEMRDRLSQG